MYIYTIYNVDVFVLASARTALVSLPLLAIALWWFPHNGQATKPKSPDDSWREKRGALPRSSKCSLTYHYQMRAPSDEAEKKL
ncbi:hypothetical protein L249_3850, partial [Ophiocordyceps polyrhachis-furcata BCC 54312]